MKTLTDREIGYLAGFFDGEGCVSVDQHLHIKGNGRWRVRTFSVNVKIANTNLEVLEWIQSKVGGHIYIHNQPRGNKKRAWQLYLSGKPAKGLFEMIEPFVIIKRQQIALAMHWFTLRGKYIPHERAALWERMRELNSGRVGNKTASSAASVTSEPTPEGVEI